MAMATRPPAAESDEAPELGGGEVEERLADEEALDEPEEGGGVDDADELEPEEVVVEVFSAQVPPPMAPPVQSQHECVRVYTVRLTSVRTVLALALTIVLARRAVRQELTGDRGRRGRG